MSELKIKASCPLCYASSEKIVYQNSGPIVRMDNFFKDTFLRRKKYVPTKINIFVGWDGYIVSCQIN